MSFLTHPIDNSPTIRGVAGADIENPAYVAQRGHVGPLFYDEH